MTSKVKASWNLTFIFTEIIYWFILHGYVSIHIYRNRWHCLYGKWGNIVATDALAPPCGVNRRRIVNRHRITFDLHNNDSHNAAYLKSGCGVYFPPESHIHSETKAGNETVLNVYSMWFTICWRGSLAERSGIYWDIGMFSWFNVVKSIFNIAYA